MPFRLSAKRVFATWSQVGDISLQDWASELEKVLDKHGCPYKYVVGLERHQDGGTHFHAVVEYTSKRNFRCPNFLDVYNKHGKYEPVRNLQDCIKYCTKDGQTITNDEAWLAATTSNKRPRLGKLVEASSVDEVLETFKTESPRDYFLYYDRIKSNAEQIFKQPKPNTAPLFNLTDFPNADPGILEWYAHNLVGPFPLVYSSSVPPLHEGAPPRRDYANLTD